MTNWCHYSLLTWSIKEASGHLYCVERNAAWRTWVGRKRRAILNQPPTRSPSQVPTDWVNEPKIIYTKYIFKFVTWMLNVYWHFWSQFNLTLIWYSCDSCAYCFGAKVIGGRDLWIFDTMVKGKVHPKIKIQTSSAHPRADEESVGVS